MADNPIISRNYPVDPKDQNDPRNNPSIAEKGIEKLGQDGWAKILSGELDIENYANKPEEKSYNVINPKPDVPGQEPHRRTLTADEGNNPLPYLPYEGPLTNERHESELSKEIKGIGTTFLRGLTGIAGFPGDAANLLDMAEAGVRSIPHYSLRTNAPGFVENLQKIKQQTTNASNDDSILGKLAHYTNPMTALRAMPTTDELRDKIFPHTGEYVGESPLSRIAMNAGEFATQIAGPQAFAKLPAMVARSIAPEMGSIASRALAEKGLAEAGGLAAGKAAEQGRASVGDLTRNALMGASAGAGEQTGAELTNDSAGGKLIGATVGAFGPSVLQNIARAIPLRPTGKLIPPLSQEAFSERLAGKSILSGAENPELAIQNLSRIDPDIKETGVLPNMAQMANDRGLDTLQEAAMFKDPSLKAAVDYQQSKNLDNLSQFGNHLAPMNASPEVAKSIASQAVDKADSALKNAIPATTKEEAAAGARFYGEKEHETMEDLARDAWANVNENKDVINLKRFKDETFYNLRKKVDSSTGEEFQRLAPTQREDVKKELDHAFDVIMKDDDRIQLMKDRGYKYDVAPVTMINPVRSHYLSLARKEMNAGHPDQARIYGETAEALRQSIANRNNWNFTSPTGPWEWAKAVDLTKRVHERFDPKILKPLWAKTSEGLDVVAPGATLDRIVGGNPAQAAQNMKTFLNATGTGAIDDVSDHMFAKLTNNGSKNVTPGSINDFIRKYKPIINEIPGFGEKLDQVKILADKEGTLRSSIGSLMFKNRDPENAAKFLLDQKDPGQAARDVVDFGNKIVGGKDGERYLDSVRKSVVNSMIADPDKMSGFIKKNSTALNNLFPDQAQRDTLTQIRKTDELLRREPDRSFRSLKEFENLTGGRILDMVVGSATGKLVGFGVGATAGTALAKAGIPDISTALEVLIGGIGSAFGTAGGTILPRLIYGDVAQRGQEILGEAIKNPKFAAIIAQKSTPATWAKLSKSYPSVAAREAQRQTWQKQNRGEPEADMVERNGITYPFPNNRLQ